jgi:methylthioribose-1-phosphate isomerase
MEEWNCVNVLTIAGLHVRLASSNLALSTEGVFWCKGSMRTVEWDNHRPEIHLIDQRLLPGRVEIFTCHSLAETIFAIREMVVRGAPAIGITAAFGMALEASVSTTLNLTDLRADLREAARTLIAARPTAVNLGWAVKRMAAVMEQPAERVEQVRERLVVEAQRMADEDVALNMKIAAVGADLIRDGDTLLHHCNTGALATVDWGTALGVIRMAHEQGKRVHVLVDETRPRLQGARLTAWELQQWGIPYDIISDNAAGYFLHRHEVQKVFFGADRVAANGDVANKIGSYMLALAAHANDVPVYSVFPTSTVDLELASGDLIPIEERSQDEVLDIQIHGERAVPSGATARNPAFDVTPHTLLTALVTEKGLIYPPMFENLPRVVRGE